MMIQKDLFQFLIRHNLVREKEMCNLKAYLYLQKILLFVRTSF